MVSLFISHSRSDRDAAERLGARLHSEAFAALFLDYSRFIALGLEVSSKSVVLSIRENIELALYACVHEKDLLRYRSVGRFACCWSAHEAMR